MLICTGVIEGSGNIPISYRWREKRDQARCNNFDPSFQFYNKVSCLCGYYYMKATEDVVELKWNIEK